jgi:PAS domain-containing protein
VPASQEFISMEYRQSLKATLEKALGGVDTANFELSICTKDHRRISLLLNTTPRKGRDGLVIGVIGVGQDITESKQVNIGESLMMKQLQIFIDTANAPIFGMDNDGVINEWNHKTVMITGFTRNEVIGEDIANVRLLFTAAESMFVFLGCCLTF